MRARHCPSEPKRFNHWERKRPMSTTLASELHDCLSLKENRRAINPSTAAAAAVSQPADDRTFLGLIELLLKTPGRVDELVRLPGRQPEFIQRFLAIALASLSLFGLGLAILLATTPADAIPSFMAPHWERHPWASGVALWLAY